MIMSKKNIFKPQRHCMFKSGKQVIRTENSRAKEESNQGLDKMPCFSNRKVIRNGYTKEEGLFD